MSRVWKKGHIAVVCCSITQGHPNTNERRPTQWKKTGQTNWVGSESGNSDSELPMHKISARSTYLFKPDTQGNFCWPQNLHRGTNTGIGRSNSGSMLPSTESYSFLDCGKRQGSQFVQQTLADALPVRLENNWYGYTRKHKYQSGCAVKEI